MGSVWPHDGVDDEEIPPVSRPSYAINRLESRPPPAVLLLVLSSSLLGPRWVSWFTSAMAEYSGFDDWFEMPGGEDFVDVTDVLVAGARGM